MRALKPGVSSIYWSIIDPRQDAPPLSPVQDTFIGFVTARRLAGAVRPPHTSGMARLFLILIIVLVAILLWRSLHKNVKSQPRTQGRKTLTMIRCDYCGLHVPEKTALLRQGRRYCSEEHRRIDNNR